MATQYLRKALLQVGSAPFQLRVSADDLRFNFEVHHDSQEEAQPSRIKVWNLRQTSVALSVDTDAPVSLEAGYGDAVGLVLEGTVRHAQYQREGLDRVLTITVGPISAIARADTPVVIEEKQTTLRDLVQQGASKLGVPIADLNQLPEIKIEDFAWAGSATGMLNELLEANGVTWTEDDGELLFSSEEKPLKRAGSPVHVGEDSGMVGTPTTEDAGKVRVKTLLNPSIRLGTPIDLESELVSGAYRVRELLHRGDTWGAEFTTELGLSP